MVGVCMVRYVLGEREEQPFDRFNFLFGEFFVSFFLSSKIKRIINRFQAMKINSVYLVTMCQMESKKQNKTKTFFLLPRFSQHQ